MNWFKLVKGKHPMADQTRNCGRVAKGDIRKAQIAARVRGHDGAAPLAYADELCMGTPGNIAPSLPAGEWR